ncbi:MAG TPA: cytidylate kinase-like family protein [Terriglobales bacterium]|nr:cytidylate kinase-like family protein [Terriglobales bacterium]
MYRVITIEREFGSGAAEIAATLADHLRWKLWDQALTQEIANVAHVDPSAVMCCDERRDSRFHRLAKTFWRGSYERNMEMNASAPFDADRFVAISEQVMKKVASAGNCVIVGRGAPYFLRDRPDVFHVFLYASRQEKIRRLRAIGKDQNEAEELVDTVDRDRMEFVKHYFNADWPTRCLYHMMINTAIGNEHALSAILSMKETLEAKLVAAV